MLGAVGDFVNCFTTLVQRSIKSTYNSEFRGRHLIVCNSVIRMDPRCGMFGNIHVGLAEIGVSECFQQKLTWSLACLQSTVLYYAPLWPKKSYAKWSSAGICGFVHLIFSHAFQKQFIAQHMTPEGSISHIRCRNPKNLLNFSGATPNKICTINYMGRTTGQALSKDNSSNCPSELKVILLSIFPFWFFLWARISSQRDISAHSFGSHQ